MYPFSRELQEFLQNFPPHVADLMMRPEQEPEKPDYSEVENCIKDLASRNDRRVDFEESTLQRLAMETVFKNLNFFTKIVDDPFSSISPSMRAKLLDVMFEIKEEQNPSQTKAKRQCKMLQLLLSNKLIKFKFPEHLLHQHRSQNAATLWNTLMKKCPQLEVLRLECQKGPKDDGCNLQPLFGKVTQFAELQEVRLCPTIKCSDLDLTRIGDNLPKLRLLSVNLSDDVSETGISALSKLPNLQEFTGFMFEDDEDDESNAMHERNLRFARLCFELLPHLLVMGIEFDGKIAASNYYLLADCTRELLRLQGPRTVGLRVLVLNSVHNIPANLRMPNVTTLVLNGHCGNFEKDERFSNISELYLSRSLHCAIPLMRLLGPQLRILAIYYYDDNDITLDNLLLMCPNLVKFEIDSGYLFSPHVTIEPSNLIHLETLNLGHDGPLMEPGLLIKLLRAPNLQHVEFNGVFFFSEDVKDIIQGVQEGEIFQKLKTFSYYIAHYFHGAELADLYYPVLKNVAQYCPNTRCKFVERGPCVIW